MTPRKQKITKKNGGFGRTDCLQIGEKKLNSKDPLVKAWVAKRLQIIKESRAYQCFTSKASRRRPKQVGA